MADEEPIELAMDGILDLHTFAPGETRELVADYLNACREKGILAVRIIHGKGLGVQREIVRSVLTQHPAVSGFRTAPEAAGGWGATVVDLLPP